MTSPAELAALLSRASAAGLHPSPAEQVAPDEALCLVLRAVRDTILPRTLTFRTDIGGSLQVAVRAGHLLTVLDVHGAPDGGLLNRPLKSSDPEQASAVADLLERLFSVAEQIAIETGPTTTPPDPMQTGLSTDQLMALLGFAPFAAVVPDPVPYFLEAATDVVIADLGPDKSWTGVQDGSAVPPALAEGISNTLSDKSGPCMELSPDECLFLLPESGSCREEALAIAIMPDKDAYRALVFDADNLPDLVAYWSGMHHGMVRLED